MTEPRHSSHSQPRWKHIWIHGFILGGGVVLIGFLVWFFIMGTASAPSPATEEKVSEAQAPKVEAQPGKTPPVAPPAAPGGQTPSAPTLESQLAQVLAGVREANQKKSLPQLLSQYSPNFPQLQQRVQHISKAWKIYDYPKMEFEITAVRLLPDKTAEARVIWTVEARNISTFKSNTVSKTYLIRFARESGQWRIKSLQQLD